MSDKEHNPIIKKQREEKAIIAPDLPPPWKSWSKLSQHVVRGALRAFLITLSVKGGISFFLSLISISKKKVSLVQVFKNAFLGESSLRTATSVGVFAFIWKAIVNSLFKLSGKHSKLNGAIAGAFAGLAIVFETKENRIGYAQNVFFRSLQAGKNALKQRKYWTIPHGDSWLFCFATASIVFAYGYRPDTIPKSYYNWLVQRCRVPKASLIAQSDHNAIIDKVGSSHFQVDLQKWNSVFEKTRMVEANVNRFHEIVESNRGELPGIPCSLYHPTNPSCVKHELDLFLGAFKDMFPVYFSLTAIPLAVLNSGKLFKDPIGQLKKSLKAAFRSTLFISFLICTFKSGMCSYFHIFPTWRNKPFVYPMALLSSIWIFLEQKSKRVELAIFVLPKAVQSVYMLMIDSGFICDLPGIEIAAASFSMSVIMSLYQLEPHNISQLLYKVMRATIGTY